MSAEITPCEMIATPQAFDQAARSVHELARAKGWYDTPVTVDNRVANMHGEVSEFWEAYRAGTLNEWCDKAQKMVEAGLPPLTCAEEELADMIIRALDCAAMLKIDIGRAIHIKHRFNSTRPYRHGGKRA